MIHEAEKKSDVDSAQELNTIFPEIVYDFSLTNNFGTEPGMNRAVERKLYEDFFLLNEVGTN